MATKIKTKEVFSKIQFMTGKTPDVDSASVISADLSMSTTQVLELTMEVDDPGFALTSKWNLQLGEWVRYEDLDLVLATLIVNEGAGEGGFTMRCRPRAVRRLKQRRGTQVMKNISPSTYVQQECRAVGASAKVQASAKRSTIARDTPPKGVSSGDDYSSWSTFQRLANELGYLLFEVGGTVYFGKPTWLMQNMPVVRVSRTGSNDAVTTVEIPDCSRSLDDDGRATISVRVPAERSGQFRPGYVLELSGMPRFNGRYLITGVDFGITDLSQPVTVTAETPNNPTPMGLMTL